VPGRKSSKNKPGLIINLLYFTSLAGNWRLSPAIVRYAVLATGCWLTSRSFQYPVRQMPSPVGHALAAVAVGCLVQRTMAGGVLRGRELVLFGALGVAPDLDLLVGMHSGPTHGVGVAVLAASVAWLPLDLVSTSSERRRLAVACALAYASHILLDWLGTDSSSPIGIMALWPFSQAYFESSLHVFPAVSRRISQPALFWSQNLRALLWEVGVLVPIVAAVIVSRRRGRSKTARTRTVQ
jgi:membrane-bound metal-dependent hydrolase YbcI (DUF457 family)